MIIGLSLGEAFLSTTMNAIRYDLPWHAFYAHNSVQRSISFVDSDNN